MSCLYIASVDSVYSEIYDGALILAAVAQNNKIKL